MSRARVLGQGSLWLMVTPDGFNFSWPIGRPRALGFELFNFGLSGMIRFHSWQLSWGLAQSWNRYCYIADRKMEKVHYVLGGGR